MGKIEQCKREHSAEFLDNRDDEWKAYAYVKASRASHSAPVLEVGDTRVMDDKEIVTANAHSPSSIKLGGDKEEKGG